MQKIVKPDFELMAQFAPVLIWVSNINKECVWFNQRWLDFSGKTMEQEYGFGWAEGVHKDDLEKCLRIFQDNFDKQKPFTMEYRLKRHDGEFRWLLDNGVPFYNEDHVFQGYVGSCIDITAQIESDNLANRVLENVHDGYWDWQIKNDYEYMSPRFWEMLGYDFKMMKPHPSEWQKYIFPEDLPRCFTAFEEHVKSKGILPFVTDLRFRHSSGKLLWIHCRGKIIEWDSEGSPVRVIGTHSDVTELKSTQEMLLRNAKLMELGETAAGIAHEINNPLTILLVRGKSLRKLITEENSNAEKIKEGIDKILLMANRISKIVKGMKNLSRNADGDAMAEFNLSDLLSESMDYVGERFKSSDIELKLSLDESKGIFLMGRNQQILQVLVNLINNAFDAVSSYDEKWIELNIHSKKEEVLISIKDSGHGISEDILEKMFNPFYTTKEPGKGTGLGLSLSKKIIEEHSGQIYYDKESKNTNFVIKLPVAKRVS